MQREDVVHGTDAPATCFEGWEGGREERHRIGCDGSRNSRNFALKLLSRCGRGTTVVTYSVITN